MVLIILCCQTVLIEAQNTNKFIIAGGNMVIEPHTQLNLKNTDLIVDGTLTVGDNSTVIFGGAGSDTVSISGTQSITLNELEINRSVSGLRLDRDITIDSLVTFTNGVIELNGNTLTLSSDAKLNNESNNSYITCQQGGVITTTVDNASAPAGINPGNLGVTLTAQTALGLTTITRGHVAQVIGNDTSILRYYAISPTVDTGLDATVALTYFDHELNNNDEGLLEAWITQNGKWINKTASSRDQNNNVVMTDSLNGLDTITLLKGAPKIEVSMLLEGAYVNGTMTTDLSDGNLIPTTEPYTASGYTHAGNGGGETVDTSTIINLTDWVVIELRDANDPTVVLHTKSALLLADGLVVDLDGKSPVFFAGVDTGSYYVAMHHRNHLGVMTDQPMTLDLTNSTLDLTDPNTLTYGTDALKNTGGVMQLYSGDTDTSGIIDANDRSNIWNDRNLSGYLIFDVNLNGVIDAADRSNTWNNRNISQQIPQ